MAGPSFLGDKFIRHDGTEVPLSDLDGKYVGIYFSAHWCPPCRGFTPVLAETYKKLKAAGKNFEIIFSSSDKDQASFDEYFHEMPWIAVPYADRARSEALSKKFKVRGIPTFVILGPDRSIVCADGRSAVARDQEGADFPWLPKPLSVMLGDSFIRNNGTAVPKSALNGKVLGLYFSAHWCPPCRGFTPKLIETYNKVKAAGKEFEVVFLSSDRDAHSFQEYFGTMPWLALPLGDKRKGELSEHFGVEGIPTLVILDTDHTSVITKDGRGPVSADPAGANFPWHPQAVNEFNEDPSNVNEGSCLVVFMENAVEPAQQERTSAALTQVAKEHLAAAKASGEDPKVQYFFTVKTADGGPSDRVRSLMHHEDAGVSFAILDIPSGGIFYVSPARGDEVNADSMRAFIEAFAAGGLEPRQFGE